MKLTSHLMRLAALSAAVSIAAGAFGAHGASGTAAELLKTGGEYELIHAVAVPALLALNRRKDAIALIFVGSLLFAFSLYALAFGAPRMIGAITPFGGLAMIAGWIWTAFGKPSTT